MQAKYYVYWNLHKNVFSVKYKGKVIAHKHNIIGFDCEFRVSEKGRQRVLREKRKNVHAYVVCDNVVDSVDGLYTTYNCYECGSVNYNPYNNSSFISTQYYKDIKKPIYNADMVLLSISSSGRPYISYGLFETA